MADANLRLEVSELKWNPAQVGELLRGPDGGVAKDLLRRALLVEAQAKRLCPVQTGRLRSSITHDMGEDAKGIFADIGTDVEYAIYVEFGTSRMEARRFLLPALDALR